MPQANCLTCCPAAAAAKIAAAAAAQRKMRCGPAGDMGWEKRRSCLSSLRSSPLSGRGGEMWIPCRPFIPLLFGCTWGEREREDQSLRSRPPADGNGGKSPIFWKKYGLGHLASANGGEWQGVFLVCFVLFWVLFFTRHPVGLGCAFPPPRKFKRVPYAPSLSYLAFVFTLM